jgi:hypothetical protein
MGQKRVIRCLNDDRKEEKENDSSKKALKAVNMEQELQNRKRELELRLAYDIESSSDHLRNILNEEKARETEIQRFVHSMISSE